MRQLIQNRDLKILFGGVSIAAAAGLLMGGAMYPNLSEGATEGPQMLLGGGGPRSAGPSGDAGLSAYAGHVPDYVIGTDALKPPQYEVMTYAEPEPAETAADTGEAGDVMAYEALAEAHSWREEPRQAVRYPSETGNAAYGTDLPAPPEPPGPDDEAPRVG